MKDIDAITERIIGCAFRVSNVLGSGFLERVYHNALAYELNKQGLSVEKQRQIQVFYDGQVVGDFAADLLVEECVLVELKAVKALDAIHQAQCLNYLKATGFSVCLLINFGTPRVEVRRLIHRFPEAGQHEPGSDEHEGTMPDL